MPYPAGHRVETKKNIIDSARRLFNRYGFENVSISQIMAGAELTHGGFYSYFKSKSDLYAEVLNCFLRTRNGRIWEGVHVDLSSTDVGAQVVTAYLSRQHFEDVEHSCPMVALPTDVARSGIVARRALETVFRAMVSVLERSLLDKKRPCRATAQVIAALSIGGHGGGQDVGRPHSCRRAPRIVPRHSSAAWGMGKRDRRKDNEDSSFGEPLTV